MFISPSLTDCSRHPQKREHEYRLLLSFVILRFWQGDNKYLNIVRKYSIMTVTQIVGSLLAHFPNQCKLMMIGSRENCYWNWFAFRFRVLFYSLYYPLRRPLNWWYWWRNIKDGFFTKLKLPFEMAGWLIT